MQGKTKKILLFLGLFLVLLAGLGYYLVNKGPEDIRSSSAIPITAVDLYTQFSKDTALAAKQYAGKVLSVSGTVDDIKSNQQRARVILLRSNTGGAYVNCTMEEDPGPVKAGDQIKLKGICSGMGEGDEDLGLQGDVYMVRCFLVK